MRRSRWALAAAVAALVVWSVPALAFHDEGVAHCNGCHTMHNSQNSEAMNDDGLGGPGTAQFSGFDDLLLFEDKTDVCLNCHAGDGSYHVWATALTGHTENGAGDFSYLLEDNINDGHGGASDPILGESAGHTVISTMMGTSVDSQHTTSPGGGYPAGDMTCVSCHDPHGNDGFRLLYKDGQTNTSGTGYVINWDVSIDADSICFFGPGCGPETNTNHNAYHAGYSQWCSKCHQQVHTVGSEGGTAGTNVHPTGEDLDTVQVGIYNAYMGTEDCIDNPPSGATPCGSGVFATAYLAAVPIEDPGTTTSSTAGATSGSSKVACVSCHRAHASSAPDAGRWDFSVTGLAEDGHESSSYGIPDPYANVYQRSLCNKCHAKDAYDAKVDFTP